MIARLNEADEAPVFVRIQRVIASGLVALALSGLALLVCNVAFEAMKLQQRLGLDDDFCWFALALGPVFMTFFHRPLHATLWAPRTCLTLGALTLVASTLVFASASSARADQVPTGPFSGIGHAMAQLLALLGGAVGMSALLGGILAMAGRRVGRT